MWTESECTPNNAEREENLSDPIAGIGERSASDSNHLKNLSPGGHSLNSLCFNVHSIHFLLACGMRHSSVCTSFMPVAPLRFWWRCCACARLCALNPNPIRCAIKIHMCRLLFFVFFFFLDLLLLFPLWFHLVTHDFCVNVRWTTKSTVHLNTR